MYRPISKVPCLVPNVSLSTKTRKGRSHGPCALSSVTRVWRSPLCQKKAQDSLDWGSANFSKIRIIWISWSTDYRFLWKVNITGLNLFQFDIMAQSSMNVTNTSVTISRLQYMHPFAGNLPSVTIHLKDANPDDIQFFIDELPVSVKGKTGW